MEFAVLGWPPDGPTLALDHRRFRYAGKFRMSATGKVVARAEGEVLAAVAFDPDRTDPATLKLRYVTVRDDRRGEGIGARLLAFVRVRAAERGFERAVIAVNNPFAYQAAYRAGYTYTGTETGLAELELSAPCGADADPDADTRRGTYQAGLDVFRERDLGEPEADFLAAKTGADPPAVVEPPVGPGAAEDSGGPGLEEP